MWPCNHGRIPEPSIHVLSSLFLTGLSFKVTGQAIPWNCDYCGAFVLGYSSDIWSWSLQLMLLEICFLGSQDVLPSSQVSQVTWCLARDSHWLASQVVSFPGLCYGATLPLWQWPLLANSTSSILSYLSWTTLQHPGISQSLPWHRGEKGDPRADLTPSSIWLCFCAYALMWLSPACARCAWGEVKVWLGGRAIGAVQDVTGRQWLRTFSTGSRAKSILTPRFPHSFKHSFPFATSSWRG